MGSGFLFSSFLFLFFFSLLFFVGGEWIVVGQPKIQHQKHYTTHYSLVDRHAPCAHAQHPHDTYVCMCVHMWVWVLLYQSAAEEPARMSVLPHHVQYPERALTVGRLNDLLDQLADPEKGSLQDKARVLRYVGG